MSLTLSTLVKEALTFSIIYAISQKLLQRSFGVQRVNVILHYTSAVLHTCSLYALHLMSCLLAHRSLEEAMVAITSPAELPEQHPTQCLHPDLSFFLGTVNLQHIWLFTSVLSHAFWVEQLSHHSYLRQLIALEGFLKSVILKTKSHNKPRV